MVKKRLKMFLGIFIPILSFFLMSQNTFAVSVGTAGFDLNYMDYMDKWQWRGGLAYNTQTSVYKVRSYQFTTPNITPTGNYATVHFETTMVFRSNSWDRLNFTNLGNLSITACNSSLGHSLSIKAQSISYAITPWVDGTVTKSLTIYGDISLGNIKKQQQQVVCAIGTGSDKAFFDTYGATGANQWFESNPMSWNYTDDQTEALLQQQTTLLQQQTTNQTTIINQNNQMLENWDNEKSENQQQGQNAENASSYTEAQTTQNTQNLMDFITAFFTAFVSASATNCNLDIGLSQYGFGTIDMCSTDIPAVFSVIINIITLVMVVPMVFWLISSIISAFKEFQE